MSKQSDPSLPSASEKQTQKSLVNLEKPSLSNQIDKTFPEVSEQPTQKFFVLFNPVEPLANDRPDVSYSDFLLPSNKNEETQKSFTKDNASAEDGRQPSGSLKSLNGDTQKRLVMLRTSTWDTQKLSLVGLDTVQTPTVIVRTIKRSGPQLKPSSSPKKRQARSRPKDPWFLLTVVVASLASLLALGYFFNTQEILLLGDTYSHMLIARRLFDTLTPGLAQIGGVWLPLPHLLMVPFVWNDYLWHTGLAGSFVAMPCYVISACYIFLTARHLTHNSLASFVGTLVFILNPNILYLQTTPLSELVLVATLAMAAYYFLLWSSDDSIVNLIRAGVSIFLATLARYDGWPVFLLMVVLIVVIGRLKRTQRARIEAQVIIFSLLGGLGIVLWCVWCYIIFKDPLYWQHSMFSSQAQQAALPKQLAFLHTNNVLFDYHNVLQALRTYSLDSIYNVGVVPCILMAISVLIFYVYKGLTPVKVAALVILVPFPFYVFSLFTGQAVIFVPHSAPPNATLGLNYYNVRYGVEMVAPAAVFVATLANSLWKFFRGNAGRVFSDTRKSTSVKATPVKAWRTALSLSILTVLSVVIVTQSILTVNGGIITLQEGQFGFDCSPVDPVALFMVQHYNGGLILSDTFTSGTTALGAEADVPFKNMVYEGSGALWVQALGRPASTVDWVIVNPSNSNDLVARNLNVGSATFLSQFTLELQEGNGLELFHRTNAPALASNSVPDALLNAHRLCPTSL